jgi:hypothetical protein
MNKVKSSSLNKIIDTLASQKKIDFKKLDFELSAQLKKIEGEVEN